VVFRKGICRNMGDYRFMTENIHWYFWGRVAERYQNGSFG